MSDATTTLLQPWEEKVVESSTPGITSFRISIQGDGHCQAIVNAVAGHYNEISGRPKPEHEDLWALIGEKVTLIQAGETMYGAGKVAAQEGTLFEGSSPDTIGILPKRSRRNGFRVKPEQVLDVFPGYATAKAREQVEKVRAHFPLVTEITRERLERLPEWDEDREEMLTMCAFGTWHMPDSTATDAIQLFATYDRENDICDGGVLLIRPAFGFSEHGSCLGQQIIRSFGEVVGYEPITFKEAIRLCDVPFDEAYDTVIGAAMRRQALVA